MTELNLNEIAQVDGGSWGGWATFLTLAEAAVDFCRGFRDGLNSQ